MEEILITFLLLSSLISIIKAQQNYSGNSVLSCKNNDTTSPSPSFLYTCNGKNSTCPAFLIFNSEPPYNSVSSISTLTSSSPSLLARINDVSTLSNFPTGKEVVIPISCSCSGKYYQANTTYNDSSVHDSYYTIANNTYQGLSTCDSLKRTNLYGEFDLKPGMVLDIPLRCACPTKGQVKTGIKYLLTYSLYWGDNITDLAKRFGVSEYRIRKANDLGPNSSLFPFTTILIPLPKIPSSSITVIHTPKGVIESPPPHPTTITKGNSRKGEIFGIAAGTLLLISIFIGFFLFKFCLCNKKKKKRRTLWETSEGKRKEALSEDFREELATIDQVLRVFKFEELEKATNLFSSENRIKGSSIYKGFFGEENLAIKKTGTSIMKEVNILNKIYHFNLITLRGICEHRSYFYLIYEYMENASLREWLDSKDSKKIESLNKRIQIGLDIANGLHYLHSFATPAYVHKDINSENILLDSKLRAKIANFGIARTAENGITSSFQSITTTTQVTGTRGYLAPEYVIKGQVSTMIDVYAFGVVLLELITGKEAVYIHEGKEVLLTAAISSIIESENEEILGDFVDSRISDEGEIGFVIKVMKLSLRCLRHDPNSRPSMGEVVSALSKIQIELQKLDSSIEITYSTEDSVNLKSDRV